MRLEHITWPQARSYFEADDIVLLGIGSCEQHGMHCPLGTDTLAAAKVLDLVEQRRPQYLIAPFIPYGSCDDFMGYSGTVSLGTELLKSVLEKITDALYKCGARRFAVINGHGGNIRALEEVGCALNRRGAWCALLNWWKIAGELNPAWAGGHGGGQEASAIMAINPSWVDAQAVGDQMLMNDAGDSMPTNGFDFVRFKGVNVELPRDVHHYAANGWIGADHPKHASQEWGQEMLSATADYIAEFLDEFEKIPLPLPTEA
ncbi:MAG: creatininase family protein [Oscillospiraceae bacterium]|nr:creatininase family protein [Oscillospiraceae bacterium]